MYDEKTVNNYLVGTSDIHETDGTNAVPGPVISADMGGKRIVVGIDLSVAGGADAAKLNIEYSHDGVNFTAPEELIADLTAETVGVKSVLANLENKMAPYYRLSLGGVGSLGDAGRFRFFYAIPANQYV